MYIPDMEFEQVEEKASAVIRQMEGCTIAEARVILHMAEEMLEDTVVHELTSEPE